MKAFGWCQRAGGKLAEDMQNGVSIKCVRKQSV